MTATRALKQRSLSAARKRVAPEASALAAPPQYEHKSYQERVQRRRSDRLARMPRLLAPSERSVATIDGHLGIRASPWA